MSDPHVLADLPPDILYANSSNKFRATAIAIIVLNVVFTILRSWSRRLQSMPWIWSDVLVPLTLVANVVMCILVIVAIDYAGAGRHTEVIALTHPEILPLFYTIMYYCIPIVWALGVAFPKLAVLDLYLNIFVETWARWCSYICGAIIILTSTVNIPVVIWQCSPPRFLWDHTVPGGHCHNIHAHFLYASLPNIATDIALLLLPIPMILTLHSPTNVKAGVAATFLTGSIGLVTSVVRFIEYFQSFADPLWAVPGATIWTITEPGIYLVAACLLSLRPLLTCLVSKNPLSAFRKASKIRKTSRNSGEISTQDKDPEINDRYESNGSDRHVLILNGLGIHSTHVNVISAPRNETPQPPPTAGILVEREFHTISSSSSYVDAASMV